MQTQVQLSDEIKKRKWIAKMPSAFNAKFDFAANEVHHVTLVCENEIVVLYVDDMKALSSRIRHSIDGAHIGVFAETGGAEFANITMKLPG